jgi:hypothetical protein
LPFAILFAACWSSPCLVGPTVEELRRGCKAALHIEAAPPQDLMPAVNCIGYVSGFLDRLAVERFMGERLPACVPVSGVSNEQTIAIFLKHAEPTPSTGARMRGPLFTRPLQRPFHATELSAGKGKRDGNFSGAGYSLEATREQPIAPRLQGPSIES